MFLNPTAQPASGDTGAVTIETSHGGAVEARDPIAELVACGVCGTPRLLVVAGRCADCIAVIGLEASEAYTAWRREVTALVERGPGAR